MKSTTLGFAIVAALAASVSTGVNAANYAASQDTYIYEFFGNQGVPAGDSGAINIWNHETNHGTQGLLQFDSAWQSDAALGGAYSATMWLYSACVQGGFVGACAGQDGTVVTTDVVLQGTSWSEGDAALGWGDISQSSTPSASFTQTDPSDGWIAVDVTALIAEMVSSGTDYGFALTQEAHGVSRISSGSLAVSSFCDSESTSAQCAAGNYSPYLEISSVSAVPVPAAVWLFGSGLLGLVGVARRRTA